MEKLTSLRTSSTRSWPRTMLEQVLSPPSLIQLPCQSLANVIPRATRPWRQAPSQTSLSSSLRPQPGLKVVFLLPERRRRHPRGDTSQVWTCQSHGAEQHGRMAPCQTRSTTRQERATEKMSTPQYGDYNQYGEGVNSSFDGSMMEGMAGSASADGNKGGGKF